MEPEPLTQGEVERQILRIVHALELATIEYAQAVHEEAEAENDWKRKYHSAVLRFSSQLVDADPETGKGGKRPTVAWVEAKAGEQYEEEVARYRLAVAHSKAMYASLSTKRASLDALRTLSANIRSQT